MYFTIQRTLNIEIVQIAFNINTEKNHKRVVFKLLQERCLILINVIIYIFQILYLFFKSRFKSSINAWVWGFLAPNEFEGNKNQVLGFIKL